MYLIYLALGIVLGRKLSGISTEKEKKSKGKEMEVAKTRKSFTTYIKDDTGSGRKVKAEEISINLKPHLSEIEQTSRPNFIALTVLWSHFQAMEDNILKEDLPAPWEQYKEDSYISNKKSYLQKHKRWNRFLKAIITNKSWTKWINNPREVRKRTRNAYKKVY